ncbi:MAG: hypothetical protein ABJA79_10385 [Parafilimonas sp.]
MLFEISIIAKSAGEDVNMMMPHLFGSGNMERYWNYNCRIRIFKSNSPDIAFKMHYSSVAHLSNQFKKVSGLTPSFFRSLKHKRRTSLEDM